MQVNTNKNGIHDFHISPVNIEERLLQAPSYNYYLIHIPRKKQGNIRNSALEKQNIVFRATISLVEDDVWRKKKKNVDVLAPIIQILDTWLSTRFI